MWHKSLIHTIRFRLTVWNTLVVLVACLLPLFAVREAMRLTMEREARQLLREEALELELAIDQLHPDQSGINEEFERKVLGHSQHDWFAGLIDESANFVWKSDNFPSDWQQGASVSQPPAGYADRKTDQWLLILSSLTAPDGRKMQIVLGEPTQFIKNDVGQLTRVMLEIAAVLLVIAPLGGYLLASRATRPVRDIIATTRSLEPRRLNSRLPIRGTGDELDQISTEINSFVDQISRYINSQREFVADAAHELRSPITAIQTSVEVTLAKPRSPAEYQEELETVSEQCQQLRHLVNQLLELAETDVADQSMGLQRVRFTELVEQSINVFAGVAEERGIAVVPDLQTNVQIQANESRLRQVINNLLDNALKFSPRGGTVHVSLSSTDVGIQLRVADSGPGVPEQVQERIFDRFFQVDAARERDQSRGNGLGLSICKSIVELHGGRIDACNTGTGLAVNVTFPAMSGSPHQVDHE